MSNHDDLLSSPPFQGGGYGWQAKLMRYKDESNDLVEVYLKRVDDRVEDPRAGVTVSFLSNTSALSLGFRI
jgi:hypothetical protein